MRRMGLKNAPTVIPESIRDLLPWYNCGRYQRLPRTEGFSFCTTTVSGHSDPPWIPPYSSGKAPLKQGGTFLKTPLSSFRSSCFGTPTQKLRFKYYACIRHQPKILNVHGHEQQSCWRSSLLRHRPSTAPWPSKPLA
jgi:hypothetical protein